MNRKIIKGLAIAFSLGIAPGAVFAQTATEDEIKKPQAEQGAVEEAPGQQKQEGESAKTYAPGQEKEEGESAKSEAPGQTKEGTTAQGEELRPEGEAGTAAEGEATTEGESGATAEGEEQRPEGEAGTAAEGEATTEGGATAEGEATTEEEGGATAEGEADVSGETTGAIDVTVEQRTEIKQVIQEVDVEPVDVDFDVSVGVAVPQTVVLQPLPPRIVEIVPEYEGYLFFVLADGRIIVVDPDTRDIVVIIV